MAMTGARVGIDLEQAAISGAQVRSARQGLTLSAAAVRALPEGVVFEGEVVDVAALAAELKAFWKESGFTGKRFSLGVANQKIVVRTMDFPLIDPKEMRAAIEFQAQEAIPIPLDDAILDFQVLSTELAEDGGGKQRVLIVAAQRDMIGRFVEAARKAGLTMDCIDLQAFALMRAIAPPVAFVDQGATESTDATALVNIGSGVTNLVVAVNGVAEFTRVINVGCEALVQALMLDRGILHGEADILRLNVGLTGSAEPVGDLEPDSLAEIRKTLDDSCESFADEIRRSVDYYHSQERASHVSALLLSGEGALTRNVCEYLGQALHIRVSVGNPLQRIAENKSKYAQQDLAAIAPRLAIALGLALDDEA